MFFMYGKIGVQGSKSGECYWEHTETACSEGWEADSYDFYVAMKGKSGIRSYCSHNLYRL